MKLPKFLKRPTSMIDRSTEIELVGGPLDGKLHDLPASVNRLIIPKYTGKRGIGPDGEIRDIFGEIVYVRRDASKFDYLA